jgi:hypothetical protein
MLDRFFSTIGKAKKKSSSQMESLPRFIDEVYKIYQPRPPSFLLIAQGMSLFGLLLQFTAVSNNSCFPEWDWTEFLEPASQPAYIGFRYVFLIHASDGTWVSFFFF